MFPCPCTVSKGSNLGSLFRPDQVFPHFNGAGTRFMLCPAVQADLPQSENCADDRKLRVAIGIIAWNEAAVIASTILSVLQQSLFRHLGECGWRCELICVCNGCSDHTPEIAADLFEQQQRRHRYRHNFTARVVNLKERGKVNAWNRFVHSLSSREARFLFLMDADIHIHLPDTLWNLLAALRRPGRGPAPPPPSRSSRSSPGSPAAPGPHRRSASARAGAARRAAS